MAKHRFLWCATTLRSMQNRAEVTEYFKWQAEWCRRLGSPLYGSLLDHVVGDMATVWPVLEGQDGSPKSSALALRFMGAVHRLVLEDRAPDLALFYPSAGGDARRPGAWEAFRTTVTKHADELVESTRRPVQTNEVGRAGALVGGFLEVARVTDKPLRVLELGASAGLNLRWDHFLYEARGATWGDPHSPVRLCDFNTDVVPPFDTRAEVIERSGCDASPLDPTTPDGRLTLTAYVWPDQVHRLRLLRGALDIAKGVPARVDRAHAAEWLGPELDHNHDGAATVVFHSIFWQYLTEDARSDIEDALTDSGRKATSRTPLAWLRMEPEGDETTVRLRMWPDGDDRVIAEAGYHGGHVRWLG
jgi:hypothetical protein